MRTCFVGAVSKKKKKNEINPAHAPRRAYSRTIIPLFEEYTNSTGTFSYIEANFCGISVQWHDGEMAQWHKTETADRRIVHKRRFSCFRVLYETMARIEPNFRKNRSLRSCFISGGANENRCLRSHVSAGYLERFEKFVPMG